MPISPQGWRKLSRILVFIAVVITILVGGFELFEHASALMARE